MGVPIDYASEEIRMGTGGAMLKGAELLKSPYPFMVINGDTLFKVKFDAVYAYNSGDCGVIMRDCGVMMCLNQEIQNGGVYMIKRNVLNDFQGVMNPFSLERQFLVEAERNGNPVAAYLFDEEFLQINEPKDVERAKVLLL